MEAFFDQSYTEEIQVSTKIRVLPSGTFSLTLDFKNFTTAYRSLNILST